MHALESSPPHSTVQSRATLEFRRKTNYNSHFIAVAIPLLASQEPQTQACLPAFLLVLKRGVPILACNSGLLNSISVWLLNKFMGICHVTKSSVLLPR